MQKFPIGFWNYTTVEQTYPEAVEDWEKLGMTLTFSPQYDPVRHSRQALLDLLDACRSRDIGVIVNDSRTRWGNAASDPAGYRERFLQACGDFGKHPAVVGFHLGDEPYHPQDFANCAAAHRICLEAAPELLPHINFLPYWPGQEKTVLKAASFRDWAAGMVKSAGLKVLCYDCYTQLNPEEEGTDNYFRNLRIFDQAAVASGISPWTTLLSVGHFRYRVPTEDDFRWQLNSAVASGMKGVLWFYVYMVNISNYRLAPIDEFGERTENFFRLSRVNRHFLHQFGDFFLLAKHTGAWHIGKAYGGYRLFRPGVDSDTVLDVTSEEGLPGIVSFFEKDGERYLAVVNNSPFESGRFTVHLPKRVQIFERLSWSRAFESVKEHRHDAVYWENEGEIGGGDWFAPGQMQLYHYR